MATENFCHICYEECSNMKQTKCNHSFCKSCFNKWMEEHDTCPMCRKQILTIKSDEQCLKEWYAHKNNEYSEIVEEFFENIEDELEDFEIDDDEDEYERRYLTAKRRILLKEFKVELLQLEKNFGNAAFVDKTKRSGTKQMRVPQTQKQSNDSYKTLPPNHLGKINENDDNSSAFVSDDDIEAKGTQFLDEIGKSMGYG